VCCIDAGPTISDNIITRNQAWYGGGIYCLRAQPVLTRNRILQNWAKHDFGMWSGWTNGPGVYCDTGSNAVIRANFIAGNRGSNGGGIYAMCSSPIIENNTITLDTAIDFGGGIFCQHSQATIRGNVVMLNHVLGYMGGFGGGIACDSFSGTLDSNIVAGNSIGPYDNTSGGGGLHFRLSNTIMRNNTVTGNVVPFGLGLGLDIDTSTLQIINTIIWGDNCPGGEISTDIIPFLSVAFSDVEGGWSGVNNFDADPLFCPEDSYRLQVNSPCIGAGQNGGDVGAGGIGCYLCGDINGDGAINVGDAVYIVNYLFRSGPPPASPETSDLNCNGTLNIGDAVYIVAYIFKSGPAPCADCP